MKLITLKKALHKRHEKDSQEASCLLFWSYYIIQGSQCGLCDSDIQTYFEGEPKEIPCK